MKKDGYVSPNRQRKEATVASLADKVDQAKALIFTNYTGLTHKQLEDMRKGFKGNEAEYTITKNTLMLRVLNDKNLPADATAMDLPTATLFMYGDVVTPLKDLTKKMKELSKPVVKYGIMEGRMLTADDVQKLSTLPGKEVLLAQLVGGLKSPIFGLHRALNWNMQKFVMTLSAVAKSKPQ